MSPTVTSPESVDAIIASWQAPIPTSLSQMTEVPLLEIGTGTGADITAYLESRDRELAAEAQTGFDPLAWLGSTAEILMSGYTKYTLMENQQEMLKLDVERQRLALARGMIGEGEVPSYGGINLYTIILFAGIGLFAMMMLRKP